MFVCQFQNIIYARIQEEAHRILQMQDIKGVIWEKLDIIHSQIPASYHCIIYGIYFTLHSFLYFKSEIINLFLLIYSQSFVTGI